MADVIHRTSLDLRCRCELFTGRRADVERLRRRLETISESTRRRGRRFPSSGSGNETEERSAMDVFSLDSSAFENAQAIPRRYSCEGDDVSPALRWANVPEGTRSLALVVDDPDAPRGVFTHWVAWGLDPGAQGLAEGEAARHEGRNGFGATGYRGPCPPPGHGRHRYVFRLYALDAEPELAAGATKAELEQAMEGHVLMTAELVGTYER
jgi:Raf kinase inhibitor-like YbhB/YbcL family protein